MALISVDELAERLGPEGPVLLDVRWELAGPSGLELYLRGRIPGAVFVDLDVALAGPPGRGGRHPLPVASEFASAMRAAGVSGARPVVVYDAGNSIAAARGWWLLRYFGHGDVAVVDGGFAAWVAAGLAVATDPASVPVAGGDFRARPGGMPLLDADGAAALARAGVLIDARTPERFRGESEPIDPVAGHIPGAVNVPAPGLVAPDGRFLDDEALRTRFGAVGVRSDLPVGAYCGSGVAASYEVLALELAGYRGALYVGSWSDWITDPDRPVAAGE
jgi:thiosulfate/3-mercaptopyruvate sulfurtransferase